MDGDVILGVWKRGVEGLDRDPSVSHAGASCRVGYSAVNARKGRRLHDADHRLQEPFAAGARLHHRFHGVKVKNQFGQPLVRNGKLLDEFDAGLVAAGHFELMLGVVGFNDVVGKGVIVTVEIFMAVRGAGQVKAELVVVLCREGSGADGFEGSTGKIQEVDGFIDDVKHQPSVLVVIGRGLDLHLIDADVDRFVLRRRRIGERNTEISGAA